MKRIATIALLATAAALAVPAAKASTNVSIGVRIGTPVYAPPAPVVVAAPAPVVVAAPAPAYCPPAPAPVVVAPVRGYWKDVSVQTWVPERYVMSRDRWGRPVRVCEPGHYAYTTQRVWVDGRHDDRYAYENRHDGRYDNRYGWNR
jgi:hypothetical protein